MTSVTGYSMPPIDQHVATLQSKLYCSVWGFLTNGVEIAELTKLAGEVSSNGQTLTESNSTFHLQHRQLAERHI